MLFLKSLNTKRLTKKNILNICKLKNEYWKYGLQSNLNWFKKNARKSDIHNLLFHKKILIGYTLLRKRKAFLKKEKKIKRINYLYFDTLIIKKNYRKKNYSSTLMDFNSKKILSSKLHSFLICNKYSIKYYRKFKWKVISKNKFKIMDHKSQKTGMVLNSKAKLKKNKILYFLN